METCRISGGLVWLLILGTHCTVTLAAPSTGHGYETKSFAQAYLECLQYLNISRQSMYAYDTAAVPSNTGGNCLLRCIGLNTRWWNDETGLNEKALVRFFRQTDAHSLEQARTCVGTVSNSSGTCDAAYRTFRCYSDALGEVIAHPEYVAPSREEIHRAVSDCATMLQVPDGQLGSCVGAETFLHDGDSTALLRCVVLRLGLYADSTGVMSDRLQLLMDSDTAQSWTEAHAAEAKRCENDLRELNSDVCVVAAHSVEICYGWRAFGALWKVLREEYGGPVDVIVSDLGVEPLVESKDVTEAKEEEQEKKEEEQEEKEEEQEEKEGKQKEEDKHVEEETEQANNAVYPGSDDVEVFSYPSSPRYRSLLMIAPKWIALDLQSDSDSSSSQQDSTPEDEKLDAVEQEDLPAEKPTYPDNVLKPEQKPEPEETLQKDPETYHVVHTRSVMYPMAPEVFPYCRSVLPPYVSRMRRSYPVSHYHPHDVAMTGDHYIHPMAHPVVKRSIPLEPMFAPAYRHFVPARFVREVVAPETEQQQLGDALETDSAVGLSEATASEGPQDQLVPLFDADSAATLEELLMQSEVADEKLDGGDDAYEKQEVADATSNDGEGDAHEEQALAVPTGDETFHTDVVAPTANDGEDHANEEQSVPVSTADETFPADVAVPTPNDGDGPAPSDAAAAPTTDGEETNVGETENEARLSDDSAMPHTNSAVEGADGDEPEAPLAPSESSNTVSGADSVPAQTPTQKVIQPHAIHRLIRAVQTTNMIRNILSALTKH